MNITARFEEVSDAEIIYQIRNDQPEFFEVLIRRNNSHLYKLGRSYGYNHEDVQDLMQETFISAYLHLEDFENRSSFRTWLIRIMLNHCYHKARRRSYQNEKPTENIPEKSVPMFSEPQPSDTPRTLLDREINHVVEAALLRIPLEYRVIFSLREISGMSTAETAETLVISESNVKVRLNRAKKMLRKEIEKVYSPEDLFEFNLVYCDAIVNRVMKHLKIRKN